MLPKHREFHGNKQIFPGPKIAAGVSWAQKLGDYGEEGVCRLRPCLNGGLEPGNGDTGLGSPGIGLISPELRSMPPSQQGAQPGSATILLFPELSLTWPGLSNLRTRVLCGLGMLRQVLLLGQVLLEQRVAGGRSGTG